MPSPSGKAWLFWGAAAAVAALDAATKWLAVQYLSPPHVPHSVIGDVVRLTLAYNTGAAFSMSLGTYSRYIFGGFALIALVVLWNLYRRSHPRERMLSLALGLAWGGAAGNLLDRVRSPRGVVDFIDIGVGSWRFWTFNVADSGVTIGAIILAWLLAHEDRRAREERRAQAPVGGT
jgi:signal peptidase II